MPRSNTPHNSSYISKRHRVTKCSAKPQAPQIGAAVVVLTADSANGFTARPPLPIPESWTSTDLLQCQIRCVPGTGSVRCARKMSKSEIPVWT